MKKTHTAIAIAAFLPMLFAACEEDLPTYDDPQAYLNFNYNSNNTDSVVNYSFVYSGGKERDTVWLTVTTMGQLSSQDRTFEIRQVMTGDNDAVAGTHYVDLSSSEEQPYLVIPAGETTARVPIFVLRDASLDDGVYNLKLEIADNGTFKPGYKEQRYKTIAITSQLSKPTQWSRIMDAYFGEWGAVKQQFMIDVTGERWDDSFIQGIISDYGMVSYERSRLIKALNEENERRAAAGEPYLQEKDGTLVSFEYRNSGY